MSITLGSVTLPGDLRWPDEYGWLPTASQVEIASNGALWIEESAQLAGRPITLESGRDTADFGWITRATVDALRALAAVPLTAPLTLTLHDGRAFQVRFRHQDGIAVEARPRQHIAPFLAGDFYDITLRLMQV